MKLLGHGFSTAASTFGGTTGGSGAAGGAAGNMPRGNLRIRKIVSFCGGTTEAPNTSGGIVFSYGQSSDVIEGTMVILPSPSGGAISSHSAAIAVELDGFDTPCNWFEAESQEAASGGWGVFVFGD